MPLKLKKKPDSPSHEKTFAIESDEFRKKIEQAKEALSCLVLIDGQPLGKKFTLIPPLVRLGRGSKSEILIEDNAISRVHAELRFQGDAVIIEDLESVNGTFVNDKRLDRPQALKEGDYIRVGRTVFKYLPRRNVENIYHEKMLDLATIDGLTKIFNKKYISDFLDAEYHRCRNLYLELSVIIFDLDLFKQLNDQYGHLAGDFALTTVCQILKSEVLRAHDAFGRWGGEEFMVVLPEMELQRACEIAERMRVTIESHPFQFEGKRLPVTVSLGVAAIDNSMKNVDDLIHRADQALYKAKKLGRNRVCTV